MRNIGYSALALACCGLLALCGCKAETVREKTVPETTAETTASTEKLEASIPVPDKDVIQQHIDDAAEGKCEYINFDVLEKYFFGRWSKYAADDSDFADIVIDYTADVTYWCASQRITKVFLDGSTAYMITLSGGESEAFVVDTANPDVLYNYGHMYLSYESAEPVKYRKVGQPSETLTDELGYIRLQKMSSELGFGLDIVSGVELTTDDGEEWFCDTGYVLAPDTPKYLLEQTENKIVLKTTLANRKDFEKYVDDINVEMRTINIRYVIEKIDGEWKQTSVEPIDG